MIEITPLHSLCLPSRKVVHALMWDPTKLDVCHVSRRIDEFVRMHGVSLHETVPFRNTGIRIQMGEHVGGHATQSGEEIEESIGVL